MGNVRPTYPISSILAAIVLAVVTMGSFLAASGSGPVSAVLRYHQALAKNSDGLYRTAVTDERNSESAELLARLVRSKLDRDIGVADISKKGSTALVTVYYQEGQNRISTIPFVVEKVDGVWLVNPAQTLATFQQLLPSRQPRSLR